MGIKTNLAVGTALLLGWNAGAKDVVMGKPEALYPTTSAAETVKQCNASETVQKTMSLARKQFQDFPKKVTIAPIIGKDLMCNVEVISNPGLQQMQPPKTKTTEELAKQNPLDKKEFKDWSKLINDKILK
jgi:hypothetical protein